MTLPPAASIRAAAAITSITMNGGTSLRADGVINCRAGIEHHGGLSQAVRRRVDGLAPLLPHSTAPYGVLRGGETCNHT